MVEQHSGFWTDEPINRKDAAKSAAYTVTDTDPDVFTLDASSGAFTITLPTAADNDGRTLTFIKTDSSTNAITLDGEGSETIDGNTTVATMDAQYDTITIYCDGTEWFIVAQKIA